MDGETCFSFLVGLIITLMLYVLAEAPKKRRPAYTNSQVRSTIEEHIHSERDRAMISRRLIDKVRFEALAEEFELSVRQTKKIVYRCAKTVFDHL